MADPKKIDDLEVGTTQFSAFAALGLLPRIGRLGPAFGQSESAGPVATAEEVQGTILALLAKTFVMMTDGKRVELNTTEKFNQVFTGKIQTLFKVVEYVINANYSGFGDGAKSVTDAPDSPAVAP